MELEGCRPNSTLDMAQDEDITNDAEEARAGRTLLDRGFLQFVHVGFLQFPFGAVDI
jgi:hypothetical protein